MTGRLLYVTLFSVYAPTLQADPAEKYILVFGLLTNVPANDKIVILSDFSARVCQDAVAWKGFLGKHGIGNCNDSGHLLLEFCAEQQLSITNALPPKKLLGCTLSPNTGTC